MKPSTLVTFFAAAAAAVEAITIADINGDGFVSPLQGQRVVNVTGLVTATHAKGIFIRSLEPKPSQNSPRSGSGSGSGSGSQSIYVYFDDAAALVTHDLDVGQVVSLDGRVDMYRSNPNYIQLPQITNPTAIVVRSTNNTVRALTIGIDTAAPPTHDFSGLDTGGGIFGLPNAAHRVSVSNPRLEPSRYGLDFWHSLLGELVTVPAAFQTSRPNKYGDVWVRGNWTATGVNSHRGITMLQGDANPETIIIGSPLDRSSNPSDTRLGDFLGDVTGVVHNAFGFYRILPLHAVSPSIKASSDFPPASFASTGTCHGLTVASYNADNLAPDSRHLPLVAAHIAHKLRLPDLIFLQEVQDDSGLTDDGITTANRTLAALRDAIHNASSVSSYSSSISAAGVTYAFAAVDPVNKADGGQPGGNIRQAYLFRPDVLELHEPNQGGSLDANQVLDGPALKYNPGRIDPSNPAYNDSRKPLAAQWKTKAGGDIFFTVNVHMESKGGSSSLHGDQRPPVNKGVEKRTRQNEAVASFIAQILAKDPQARIITAGDFNEFAQVQPLRLFAQKSGLTNLDDVVNTPPQERYTYLYDMNCQSLDHMYVSQALLRAGAAKLEHLHLNTWQTFAGQVSDHDPSVAQFNVCATERD